jgi:hypothetical protein
VMKLVEGLGFFDLGLVHGGHRVLFGWLRSIDKTPLNRACEKSVSQTRKTLRSRLRMTPCWLEPPLLKRRHTLGLGGRGQHAAAVRTRLIHGARAVRAEGALE